jgi:hypothetical protein
MKITVCPGSPHYWSDVDAVAAEIQRRVSNTGEAVKTAEVWDSLEVEEVSEHPAHELNFRLWARMGDAVDAGEPQRKVAGPVLVGELRWMVESLLAWQLAHLDSPITRHIRADWMELRKHLPMSESAFNEAAESLRAMFNQMERRHRAASVPLPNRERISLHRTQFALALGERL